MIRGTTAEVFDITATGGTLSASSFNLADAPSGAGSPTNFFGLIGLTNYLGTAGSGAGYIAATSAAVTPVPLPAALCLLLQAVAAQVRLHASVKLRKHSLGRRLPEQLFHAGADNAMASLATGV